MMLNITESELQARLDSGEDQYTEFKLRPPRKELVAEIAVSFANGLREGWLIIGIKETVDKAEIIGVLDAESVPDYLYKICQTECNPPISPEFAIVSTTKGNVVVMQVKGEQEKKPYSTSRGEFFVRRGPTGTEILTDLEIEQYLQELDLEEKPPLRSIHIRNFLSLYNVDIKFKPITIIIGPNASGKSNLFKALRFLHTGMDVEAKGWDSLQKQGDELAWFGAEKEERVFEIVFELKTHLKENTSSFCPTYQISLRPENGGLKVRNEKLDTEIPITGEPDFFFERTDNTIDTNYRFEDEIKPEKRIYDHIGRFFFRDYASDFLSARLFTSFVRGWRFVDVDVAKARSSSIGEPEPQSIPPLEGDASNLSEVLFALSNLDRERFDEIVDRLGRAIGFPQEVLVNHIPSMAGPGEMRYAFFESAFPGRAIAPSSISDGTIRLLANLTALIGDPHASLICIEEPDRGLHPNLMLRLADAMRAVVNGESVDDTESPPQLVVTTHSPDFMDCFDILAEEDYLQVFIADRDLEDGKTIFISATEKTFKPWLKKYRLGDAVRRGVFS
ncbi:MAG: AAA family ATPase [Anaerolineales bacterium]|nr:AAA family ATPase [Anaerolineales bacterium]